jgi:hypothetical protein
MSKECQVPFMRVRSVLLAIATLLCANIATAIPPPTSIKVPLCKAVDATLAASCRVLRAPTNASRPAARQLRIHMAVWWVVHQASVGNFHPIVEGILIEVKKLRSELRAFFLANTT